MPDHNTLKDDNMRQSGEFEDGLGTGMTPQIASRFIYFPSTSKTVKAESDRTGIQFYAEIFAVVKDPRDPSAPGYGVAYPRFTDGGASGSGSTMHYPLPMITGAPLSFYDPTIPMLPGGYFSLAAPYEPHITGVNLGLNGSVDSPGTDMHPQRVFPAFHSFNADGEEGFLLPHTYHIEFNPTYYPNGVHTLADINTTLPYAAHTYKRCTPTLTKSWVAMMYADHDTKTLSDGSKASAVPAWVPGSTESYIPGMTGSPLFFDVLERNRPIHVFSLAAGSPLMFFAGLPGANNVPSIALQLPSPRNIYGWKIATHPTTGVSTYMAQTVGRVYLQNASSVGSTAYTNIFVFFRDTTPGLSFVELR